MQLRQDARSREVGVQEVLFDVMVEPALEARAPWWAEHRARAVANDSRKLLVVIALRALVDVVAFFCAARFAFWLRFENSFLANRFPPDNSLPLNEVLGALLISLPVLLFFLKACGMYETRIRIRTLDKLPKIITAVNSFVITLLISMFLLNASSGYRGYIVIFWFSCVLFILAARLLLQIGYSVTGATEVIERNTLLVGAGQVGKALALKLSRHPEFGLRPVGFIDDHPLIERFSEPEIKHLHVLGGLRDTAGIIRDRKVEKVIVGFSRDSHESMLELVTLCNNLGVEVSVLPRLFEVISDEVLVHEIGGISMVPVNKKRMATARKLTKSVEDYALCLAGLLLCWPVLLAIAAAIKLDSPGPVLYRQTRIGKNGRPFQFFKFRSMVDGADRMRDELENGRGEDLLFKITDDPRITRVGRWIRKFSLDEVPQVFNVLRGQMSVVGPRPGLPEEVERYKGWHRLRLNAKPGITGLWQVNGRSDLPFDEMVKYDLYYIECSSLWLDAKTIIRTVAAVLRGKGAY